MRYADPSGHDPITITLLLVAAGAFLLSACAPTPETPAVAPEIASTINITDANGGHYSLGTAINTNTAVTHNHFQVPLEDLSAEGQAIEYFDPVGTEVGTSGQSQTGLITVDHDLSATPSELASQEVITSLVQDDTVQVTYWDDANQEIALDSFTVNSPAHHGFLILNDPNQILNVADSGGGVYYNGQLIGNLWGYDDQHRIYVALLPSNVNNFSKATAPVQNHVR